MTYHLPFKHFEARVVEGLVVICASDGFPPPQDQTFVVGMPGVYIWG